MKKAQKEKVRNLVLIIVATSLACVLVISSIIGGMHLLLGEKKSNPNDINYEGITVGKPEIKEELLSINVNSRPGESLEKVKGIVIHYTANPGASAQANRNYFESRKECADELQNKVSSHFIVGIKGEIIQCIPENEIAYASNKRNRDTISIECCHKNKSGKFTKETYQSLINLVSYLCDKYELQCDTIIRHYDVTKKLCPKYYVNHPKAWKQLKKDVEATIKNAKTKE